MFRHYHHRSQVVFTRVHEHNEYGPKNINIILSTVVYMTWRLCLRWVCILTLKHTHTLPKTVHLHVLLSTFTVGHVLDIQYPCTTFILTHSHTEHMHTHMHTCMHICTHARTHTHTHTHTRTHTRTHAHTHYTRLQGA